MITLKDLSEAVNLHDPEGLLRLGCPPDEYIDEVRRVFSNIKNSKNLTQGTLYRELREVFESRFGGSSASTQQLLRLVSEDLFDEVGE